MTDKAKTNEPVARIKEVADIYRIMNRLPYYKIPGTQGKVVSSLHMQLLWLLIAIAGDALLINVSLFVLTLDWMKAEQKGKRRMTIPY